MPIHKNTAHDVPFALVNSLTGEALTGASVTAYRCLDGGVQTGCAGSVTELGNGQYLFEGAAADFNADYTSGLLFVASNAVPVHVTFQMTYFRKDTTYNIPFLLLNVNTSQGLTGATPSGVKCLDGEAQVAVSGAFVERGRGQYVFQATTVDFGAEDIAGFLITATNAVPVHLIIDLLESYAPTTVLTDTPAAVLANYVTGLALMTVPSANGSWPLYISNMPDAPNNLGAIYNTTPSKDARSMEGGGIIQHYGVQIGIRCSVEETGWDKCNVLAGQLAAVHNAETILNGDTYTIHNVSIIGGVNSLGKETGTKRRNMFTMNFLVDISKN
jgi:hypothetical protein